MKKLWVFGFVVFFAVSSWAYDNPKTSKLSCSRVVASQPVVISRSLHKFRLATYNTANFRLAPIGQKKIKTNNIKKAEDVERLGLRLKNVDADFLVLQEVDSVNELEYLNDNYLGGAYRSILNRGNDSNGLEIGFLVKKDLDIEIEIQNHRDLRWTDPVTNREIPVFTRDAPTLIIRKNKNVKPSLIVIGHHAKSKAGNKRDFQSNRLRTVQHEALRDIVNFYKNKYGDSVPIIIAGDFNTDIHYADETKAIMNIADDTFDLQPNRLSPQDRVTHVTFVRYSSGEAAQLDGILLAKGANAKIITAQVLRDAKNLPQSLEERHTQISDHYLVFSDIELTD